MRGGGRALGRSITSGHHLTKRPCATPALQQPGVDRGAGRLNDALMVPQAAPHDDAVVFRQSRRTLLCRGLIAIAFAAMGVSFITHPGSWTASRLPPDLVEMRGWATACFFSLALIPVAASLARPTTVALGADEVTISTAWRTYTRPWSAVGDFRIWRYRRSRIVIFNDAAPSNGLLAEINRRTTGATSAMPTALNVGPEDLLAALQAAKDRWEVAYKAGLKDPAGRPVIARAAPDASA